MTRLVWAPVLVAIAGVLADSLSADSWFEQFNYTNISSSPWKISTAKKAHDEEIFAYDGEWQIESPYKYATNDTGLVLKTKAAHHGISYRFDEPFVTSDDQPLVLQYEVKLQSGLDCGGAYVKLLDATEKNMKFHPKTPFQVMFGPDRCGANSKVHFIISRQSPVTGEVSQKHLVDPPLARYNFLTNLYTLIIDNDHYEIRINGKVAQSGSLTDPDTFLPKLNPVEEIVDENDSVPLDWDHRQYIPDPNEPEKPEWWDAKHGRLFIADPKDQKPDDWLDEESPLVEVTKEKPDDWEEDRDGEWESTRLVPNPKCKDVSGCGRWNARSIPNPDYRTGWRQPQIDNPNYSGEWSPRNIPNPEYYNDTHPWRLETIGGIGFDLWSMNPDIFFTNIYLGHSVEEAEAIGNSTFLPKYNEEVDLKRIAGEEEQEQLRMKPLTPPPSSVIDLVDDSDSEYTPSHVVVEFVKYHIDEVQKIMIGFMLKPIPTILGDPIRILLYLSVIIIVFSFAFGVVVSVMFMISGVEADGSYEDNKKKREQRQRREEEEKANDEEGVQETEEVSRQQVSETHATKRHLDKSLSIE